MVALYPRFTTHNNSIIRSQESNILSRSEEAESTTQLSRQPDLCPKNDNDNKDIIMLPDDLFLNLIDLELQKKIAMSDDLDSNAAEALKLLLETVPTSMTTGLNDWTVDRTDGRNILFYKGKNYIPRNTELQREIVKTFHDHETAGHPDWNLQYSTTTLLVAGTTHLREELRTRVWNMPTIQNRQISIKTCLLTH